MNEGEVAYLAGIIDGEGCIIATFHPNGGGYLRLSVGTTNPELVKWLLRMFPNEAHLSARAAIGSKKPIYHINWHNQKAIDTLRMTLPYLVIKRKQAEVALSWPLSVPGKHLPLGADVLRVHIQQELRRLKHE